MMVTARVDIAPALTLMLDPAGRGEVNMARDVALLDACARGDMSGAVRLYGFSPPCISIGRLQPVSDIDVERCARDGVEVVRRPSGGRAVLHDQEVTYTVVCRTADAHFGGTVLESCARIHEAVAVGLLTLGIATTAQGRPGDVRAHARALSASPDCFARPAAHELLDAEGHKLVGSAQARRGPALLQHGSVLLEPARAAPYLGVDSTTGGSSAGLRGLLGRYVTEREVRTALVAGFADVLGARLCDEKGDFHHPARATA